MQIRALIIFKLSPSFRHIRHVPLTISTTERKILLDSRLMYPYAAELSDLITIYSYRLITCLDITKHCINIIKNRQGY